MQDEIIIFNALAAAVYEVQVHGFIELNAVCIWAFVRYSRRLCYSVLSQ